MLAAVTGFGAEAFLEAALRRGWKGDPESGADEGTLADPAPPSYVLPPRVAARRDALGSIELSKILSDPEEISELVSVLAKPDLCRLGPWRASFS